MSTKSLLDQLRLRTNVDCDTLDVDVATSLGPFVDSTSNQVIALTELRKPLHVGHARNAGRLAVELQRQYSDVGVVELAAEIGVSLQHTMYKLFKECSEEYPKDDIACTANASSSQRVRSCANKSKLCRLD